VLLHSTLDLPDFLFQSARLLDGRQLALEVLLAVCVGSAAWCALAATRRLQGDDSWGAALAAESGAFAPLWLRPTITLLALFSIAWQPTFPYAATLPVALTQDWGIAQDAAILAALLAWRLRSVAWPTPRPASIFWAFFLLYALAVPERARVVEGHPGNEPKYLRMGVTLGHSLSLDVKGIEGPMEELPVTPLPSAARHALGRLGSESVGMLAALARGPSAVGLDAIRASRSSRQTIIGKDGGIYHVLAPGPSAFLAPLLRIDRALNQRLGTPGRLRVTMLGWNAVAAALIVALFLLIRDATGSAGWATLLAVGFAAAPPYLFYFYQFYPEMPGTLLIAFALRRVFFVSTWRLRGTLILSCALATLPWWHQKFLPIWAVLAVFAIVRAVDALVPARVLAAMMVPQFVTLLLTALYNFAITGSVRPDAMFRAWGPGGITTAHLGQGFFGLLLDIHYGILPYAPIYLLALGGVALTSRGARRLRLALPVIVIYYLTVAAADDWHGAVSHLGRYVMPATPYAITLVALLLQKLAPHRGALALALVLAAWTGLNAHAMWLDPHAADNALRHIENSAIADGTVYVPNLFIESMNRGGTRLFAQLLAWFALGLLLAFWLVRTARRAGPAGLSNVGPACALVGLTTALFAAAIALESWPSRHRLPRFTNQIELRAGTTAFVEGATRLDRSSGHVVSRDDVDLLVRSRSPLSSLAVFARGHGFVGATSRAALPIRESGRWVALPLVPVADLTGRRGVREWLYRGILRIDSTGPVTFFLALDTGNARRD
jgi:hypothetical protein